MHAIKALSVISFAMTTMAGQVIIRNNCDYPIYMWSVGDEVKPCQTIEPGHSVPEDFYSKKDGGGPSLKISRHEVLDNTTPLTQLEYTVAGNLWYDLSNIDLGNTGEAPFAGKTLDLVPSKDSCPRVVCPAGELVCSAAYNQPEDNKSTHACDGNADLLLEVCQRVENSSLNFKALIKLPLVSAREAESEAEAAPATHVHKALSHVHERIRRSRIFGRR